MRRTSFYLIAATTLLVGLLAGCGSSTPPPLETLSGEWLDTKARVEVCGETDYMKLQMDLSLESDDESVYGDMALINDYGDFYAGSFSGRITSSGKLTGVAEVFDDWSYELILFSANLTFKSSGVSGTLTEVDGVECEDGRPGKFSIKVNLQRESDEPSEPQTPVEDDALEPNNSQEEAAEIELDYQADLVLQDDDWFTFTLDDEQLVTIDVQAKDTSHFYVDAALYDEASNVISDYDIYDSSTGSKPRTFHLAAGTYTLELSGDIVSATKAYNLTLSSKPIPDAALEPNDSAQSATILTLGAEAQPMYLSKGDEDWFTFTLDKTQVVTFDLQSESYGFSRTLFDSELTERNSYTYGSEPFTFTLAAGTYYLKAYSSYNDAMAYSVRISREDLPDSALEPNDASEQAAAIKLDASGNFSGDMHLTNGDEDWFALTLDETRLVTFDLGDSYYKFNSALYDAELEIRRGGSYKGNDFTVALSAGTHYLRVYDYGYSSGLNYPLKVTSEPIPDAAYEPNGSFNTASPIQLPFTDELYMAGTDEDWFSFTLTEEQLVTLASKGTYAYSYRVDGAFYTADGTELDGKTFSLEKGDAVSFILPADTYVVSLSSPYYYDDRDFPYALSITSEAIPDLKYEPNNSRDEAHAIALGFSDDNLLVSSDDADWFSFTLNSATQVNFTLETRGDLRLHLHDDNSETVQRLYRGSSAPVLSAGTYYLEAAYRYNDAPKYSLSVARK